MESAILGSSGDTAQLMADHDVCIAVGEDLQIAYPGYLWMVGADHKAGTISIDLQITKPIGLERYGYMLYISTVLGAGGQKAVRRAGGELLERFGLRRGMASPETFEIAYEHGLDIDNNKNKSKY